MNGGTTFHFVTDGIHDTLKRAVDEAKGEDVRLGGGVATIRQYLRAGLIDEMHLAMSPVLLGSGESLLEGINALPTDAAKQFAMPDVIRIQRVVDGPLHPVRHWYSPDVPCLSD
jgi:dihydrofolate reductase